MADPLRTLNKQQELEADTLSSEAAQAALAGLTQTTVTAAKEAIAMALSSAEGTVTQDRVSDVAIVRQAIQMPLAQDLLIMSGQALNAAQGAIKAGYLADLTGRAAIFNESDAAETVIADMGPEDEAVLELYPILGRTAEDWARRLAEQVRWDVEGVLVGPVASGARIDTLPEALDEVRQAHAKRVKQLVTDAYLAGVQASTVEWTAYMAYLRSEQRRQQ